MKLGAEKQNQKKRCAVGGEGDTGEMDQWLILAALRGA